MIVEDGTGKIDSNSYVSLEYADDYFSVRSESSWDDLEDDKKEVLLIKATDYIDNAFKWNGKKLVNNQALRFPRQNLVDYEGSSISGIPNCLKDSVCECALLIFNGTEMYQTIESNGAVTSEKIGQLAFTYDVTQKTKDVSLFESINLRLRGLYEDTSKSKIVIGSVKRV